jgi:hypothetical protein
MQNVIEIPETVEEKHVEHSYKTLPPMPAPRRGFVSKITAVLKSMRRNERSAEHSECYATPEMPLDILAREHPYFYIKAMVG